jgi:hypothetical protein
MIHSTLLIRGVGSNIVPVEKKNTVKIWVLVEKKNTGKNHFRSKTLFGRRFCLSGLKVTSLGSGRQIGKDCIELRK